MVRIHFFVSGTYQHRAAQDVLHFGHTVAEVGNLPEGHGQGMLATNDQPTSFYS